MHHMLEESARGTIHASSVKPLQKKKDVRDPFMSMMLHHDGRDKWIELLQACDNYLHTGNGRVTITFPYQGMCQSIIRVT